MGDETIADSVVRYRLRDGWLFSRTSDGLVFHCDVRLIRVTMPPARTAAVAAFLSAVSARDQSAPPDPALSKLLERLASLGVLVSAEPGGSPQVASEWSPLAAYFEATGAEKREVLKALAGATVLVLGLGGTGAVVLQHLAGAGIGGYVLVDHDRVEASNLTRQFIYPRTAVGQLKTDAAGGYVSRQLPCARVLLHHRAITTAKDVDVVLSGSPAIHAAFICIDTPPETAFDLCADSLWSVGIPFIHGGVMPRSGFYGPLFDSARLSPPPVLFGTGAGQPKPTESCFSPYNTVIGACMAGDVLHHLAGQHHLVDYKQRTVIRWPGHVPVKVDVPSRPLR